MKSSTENRNEETLPRVWRRESSMAGKRYGRKVFISGTRQRTVAHIGHDFSSKKKAETLGFLRSPETAVSSSRCPIFRRPGSSPTFFTLGKPGGGGRREETEEGVEGGKGANSLHRRKQAQVLLAPKQPGASFPTQAMEGTVAVFAFLKKSICKSIVLSWLTS